MTSEGMTHLLSLICLLLPTGHLLPNTFNIFRKQFISLKRTIVFHYFCTNCLTYLEFKEMKQCPNTYCSKDLTDGMSPVSYFLEIPIIGQLQDLFTQKDFYSHLQYRFKIVLKNPNNIEDVYDGQLYNNLFENGILSSPDNILFMFNTDAAAVLKSSKVQVWPLYLSINELPYKLRTAKENFIFAGLWFGKKSQQCGLS